MYNTKMGIKDHIDADAAEVLSDLHRLLKSVPLKVWNNFDASNPPNRLKACIITTEKSMDDSTSGLSILGRYALLVTEDEFITTLVESKLPEISLTHAEERALNNGFVSVLIVGLRNLSLSLSKDGIGVWWEKRSLS